MKILLAALVFTLLSAGPISSQPAGYREHGEDCAEIQQQVLGRHWTSLLLAQIEVESAWRSQAQSPYARGLTQFTPQTERAIEERYNIHGEVWDIEHACLLQSLLIRDLAKEVAPSFEGWLSQWGAVFRTYNGSPRNFWREWKLAGRPTNVWLMEGFCVRKQAFCDENQSYPHKIVNRWSKYFWEWRA